MAGDASSTPSRWLVLGPGGGGKSRLSLRMAEILDLPLVHLDRQYWQPGWVETPEREWDARVVELAAGERWIMDGNYSRTLPLRLARAEAAVLLDPPPWVCAWRAIRRGLSSEPRPDLAEGCEDRLPDRQFLWWILSYRWRTRPKVLRRIGEHPHVRLHHLRGARGVRAFLEGLAAGAG